MEHEIALVVWNEFIAQAINEGCNFSFNNLEKRIKETINEALGQHDVIKNEVAVCECHLSGKVQMCSLPNCHGGIPT